MVHFLLSIYCINDFFNVLIFNRRLGKAAHLIIVISITQRQIDLAKSDIIATKRSTMNSQDNDKVKKIILLENDFFVI